MDTASLTGGSSSSRWDGMAVAAENALYVGNDMYHDIFGAREAGLKTVMFDSDQGKKAYLDCVPDYTITDLRDLLPSSGYEAARDGLAGRLPWSISILEKP